MKHPDVDIDFANRKDAIAVLPAIQAMMERDGKIMTHPSGVYFQDVPVDPFTKLAALPYEKLDDLGYFKVDLLNQSVYEGVRDDDHLTELLSMEPLWELLDEPEMVARLPHIHNHYEVVQQIAPKSVDDLAVILALQRPGKRHLQGRSRAEIDREIWDIDQDGEYAFKRSHAISYATLVVVKMNLLVQEMMAE
jgi:hypothetical protein